MLGQKIIAQVFLRLVSTALGFGSSILVARAFLPEVIGEVAFILGICSLAVMFFDLGFSETANTKIAQEKFTPASNLVALLYFKGMLSIVFLLITLGVFFANHTAIDRVGVGIFLILALALYLENIV